LNIQSVELEFQEHFKRTLTEYFSPIHHHWIECIKIQSHTQKLIVISLFNTKQVGIIEKNKTKFDDILSRECCNAFGYGLLLIEFEKNSSISLLAINRKKLEKRHSLVPKR
jgi:D-lyxose ketol-isomerase